MKRILFCLTFIMIFSAGFANAQPPGNTFTRLGTVTPTVGIDSIQAGVIVSFPIIYGNRDTNSYNVSNSFVIYSDADGIPSIPRGTGTATWAHATGDGGNFKGFNPDVFGIWLDTTGFFPRSAFSGLYKISCFGCNGAGGDTLAWSGAGGLDPDGLPTLALRPKDSGVQLIMKILTKTIDHGKFICIDSTSGFPPTNTWKWPAFNIVPGFNTFPTWSGAKCFKVVDPNRPANQPPTLSPIGNQNINEGQLLNVIVNASDPDLTIPFFTTSPLPTGASFVDNGNGSAQLSWTPGYDQAGTYYVTITASDNDGLTDAETVQIIVNNTNRPPVLTLIGAKTVAEGQNLNFVVSGSDPDGGLLNYSASPIPAGAIFNPTAAEFNWTPDFTQANSYDVLFSVSDGFSTDTETVRITVTNTNRPPVLAPIGPRIIMVGEILGFPFSASDSDGDAISLNVAPIPTNATFTDLHNGTGSFTFTPTADQVGDHIVTFTAADNSLNDQEIVTITVIPKTNFLVVTPDTLKFVTRFGLNPPTDSFQVTKGGDTEIDFSVSLSSGAWLVIQYPTRTPSRIHSSVNAIGMPVGHYFDSLKISGAGVPDKYAYVQLTINPCPVIQLSKTAFYDTVFVGEFAGAGDSINVTSTGETLGWSVSPSPGFTFPVFGGETPDKARFTFNEQFNSAGSFQRCFTVAGSSFIPEDPCSSQVQVCVNIVVNQRPCVSILTSETLLSFTAVQGDAIATPNARVFTVSSSDASRNFAFEAKAPISTNWIFFDSTGGTGSFSGTTPTQVPVQVRPGSLGIGTHIVDIVVASFAEEVCLPKLKTVRILLTVTRRPSADTVLVENKPAVLGQTVFVPVNFINSCPLESASLSLKFDAANLHLSAVTYGGSKLGYVTNKSETIDNGAGTVQLTVNVGTQALVPDGFGNWATLVFVVRPEATAGFYPITLENCDCNNPHFMRDCGQDPESQIPEFVSGGIVVDQLTNSVCGYVVDTNGVEIPGATVQLWANFPNGAPELTTTTSSIGSFFFEGVTTVPFDLYAFANGYYPNKAENLNFNTKGIKIVLSPLATLSATSEWVDYYCNQNTYFQAPLPVGSVVEARSPDNRLVGRFVTTTSGRYGFMPVYRANTQFGDPGATAGDNIRFFVNGVQALTTGNTVYPTTFAEVQVCLEFGGSIIQTCALQEGWNLVSWPVQTRSNDILTVLGPYMNCIEVILGFEQGGLTYDPTLPEFSTLWSVDQFSGYWIKVKPGCSVTLSIEGLPVPVNTPIPANVGWNLVSYLPKENLTPAYALQSIYDKLLFAYGWDNGIQIFKPGSEFNTLNSMMPCKGYWVKITADDTLIYPEQGPAVGWMAPREVASVQSLSNGDYTTTNWVNLYATNLKLDGQSVTSGSVIDAYSVDSDAKAGSFKMNADGTFGFMPVYADAEGVSLKPGGKFYLTVDGTKTKETFTWTANGDRMLVASLSSGNSIGTLPDGFSLGQNYPNPFNPTTNISFLVPVNTRARIEIYNVLGELIAVPFDDAVQAGEHQVVWNGRNQNGESVASGIYLYKLVSNSYSETRKMMLLK